MSIKAEYLKGSFLSKRGESRYSGTRSLPALKRMSAVTKKALRELNTLARNINVHGHVTQPVRNRGREISQHSSTRRNALKHKAAQKIALKAAIEEVEKEKRLAAAARARARAEARAAPAGAQVEAQAVAAADRRVDAADAALEELERLLGGLGL